MWVVFDAVIDDEPFVFEFLIFCSVGSWQCTFYFVERACDVSGKDVGVFQAKLMRALTKLLIDGACALCPAYFELAWFFLFFRTALIHSHAFLLLAGVQPSPPAALAESIAIVAKWHDFADAHPALCGLLPPDGILESAVIDAPLDEPAFVFGLRSGPAGEWLDLELAQDILHLRLRLRLRLHGRYRDEAFLDFCLVLASFIVRFAPRQRSTFSAALHPRTGTRTPRSGHSLSDIPQTRAMSSLS
jgi:hypothetical protein